MPYPHQDPEAEAEALREAQLRGEGRGCGGCRYLGFGPGIAARCVHPERWCYVVSLSTWALGCGERVALLDKWHPGEDPHPQRVDLGEHCESLFLLALEARRAACSDPLPSGTEPGGEGGPISGASAP